MASSSMATGVATAGHHEEGVAGKFHGQGGSAAAHVFREGAESVLHSAEEALQGSVNKAVSGLQAGLRKSLATLENIEHSDEVQNLLGGRNRDFMMLFRFSDTFIPLILSEPIFWIAQVFFIGALVMNAMTYSSDAELERSGMNAVRNVTTGITSAMVFYLSFYQSQVYNRYERMWVCAQVAYGRINDLNLLVPAYMDKTPKLRDRVMRYVNAYHHIVYLDQGGIPRSVTLNLLVYRNLLTHHEEKLLIKMDCSIGMRVLIWATQTIAESDINPMYQSQMNDLIVILRRNMAFLWSYDDQPVPFIYYHIVTFLVLIGVILQSIANAFLLATWYIEVPGGMGTDHSFHFSPDTSSGEDEYLDKGPTKVFRVGAVIFEVLLQLVYSAVLIGIKKVGDELADPFDHPDESHNGIPSCRYMDLHVSGDSKLANYHDVKPPSVSEEDAEIESEKFKAAHTKTAARKGLASQLGGVDLSMRVASYGQWIDRASRKHNFERRKVPSSLQKKICAVERSVCKLTSPTGASANALKSVNESLNMLSTGAAGTLATTAEVSTIALSSVSTITRKSLRSDLLRKVSGRSASRGARLEREKNQEPTRMDGSEPLDGSASSESAVEQPGK